MTAHGLEALPEEIGLHRVLREKLAERLQYWARRFCPFSSSRTTRKAKRCCLRFSEGVNLLGMHTHLNAKRSTTDSGGSSRRPVSHHLTF